MQDTIYRGWRITDGGPQYHPITGRFCASRYGVDLSAGTYEAAKQMIDQRIKDYPWEGKETTLS